MSGNGSIVGSIFCSFLILTFGKARSITLSSIDFPYEWKQPKCMMFDHACSAQNLTSMFSLIAKSKTVWSSNVQSFDSVFLSLIFYIFIFLISFLKHMQVKHSSSLCWKFIPLFKKQDGFLSFFFSEIT